MQRNQTKPYMSVSFTLVCDLPEFGVPRTVGCPSVARLLGWERVLSVGGSVAERDGPKAFRERRTDPKHGTDVSFTFVCVLLDLGVIWTVGWLAVIRLFSTLVP